MYFRARHLIQSGDNAVMVTTTTAAASIAAMTCRCWCRRLCHHIFHKNLFSISIYQDWFLTVYPNICNTYMILIHTSRNVIYKEIRKIQRKNKIKKNKPQIKYFGHLNGVCFGILDYGGPVFNNNRYRKWMMGCSD